MKILVVEDDQAVAQILQILLFSYSYAVDLAADGETGLQMAEAFAYDLMVLDVVLPKLDGISLCQQLRAKGYQNPILLLTGQGEGRQKAIALNAGADDYVVKPFDSEELVARIQALLRRGAATTKPILTWGSLSFDPNSRKVTYGTHLLSVTPKEYAILELFLRHSQKAFSASAILDQVWNSAEAPSEEAVRVHIKEIRHKLRAAGAPKDFIKTVYQAGYRLNPLYSSVLADQVEQQPTLPHVAELAAVNEELRVTLATLQTTQDELCQQNEELKLARHTLEQERQRYEDLFEFAPDGYVVTDCSGTIQAANRAAANLLAISADDLRGQPLDAFIAKADRRTFQTRLLQLSWQPNWEVTLQNCHAEPIPVLVTVTTILDAHSQLAGIRWSLRDIRYQKQIEQQLRAAQDELELRVAERTAELMRANVHLQQQQKQRQAEIAARQEAESRYRLIENNPNPMWFYDPDTLAFLEVNQAAIAQYHYSRAEFLQMTLADIAPVRDFAESDPPQIEPQHRRKDGSSIDVEVTVFRLPMTGKPIHLALIKVIPETLADQPAAAPHPIEIQSETQGTTQAGTQANTEHKDPLGSMLEQARTPSEIELHEMSTALSNALEGISRLDQQGRYIFVNEAYARGAGYTPAEMVGMNWQQTVHPDDIEPVGAAFERMSSQGKAEVEARGIRKDGAVFYKQLFLVAVAGQGQLAGHYCFMKDISERKQAEAALQQQLAREQLVAEITHSIRQTLDFNQILQRAVDQVRQLLQTDRTIIFRFQPNWHGQIVTESIAAGWASLLSTNIFDPCFKERYIEPYRQGRVSAICDLEAANVEPCYVELLKNFQVKANLVVPILQSDPVQEDHLWGLLIAHHCTSPRTWQDEEIGLLKQLANQLGIAIQQSELYQQTRRELLERRRMQEALQESEERFRSLSASVPIGIVQTNADGICLYVNAYWQEMTGLSLEESLGNGWMRAIHPDDRETVSSDWERYTQGKGEVAPEFRLLTPHAEVRWVLCRVAPIQSSTGEIIGYVRTQEDITDRKQAGQKIREQAALIDIATDAIFVCDLENRVLFWNQGAERLYGWTAAEILGQTVNTLFQNDAALQLQAGLAAIVEQGVWQGELDQQTKTRQAIAVASRWTLVRDEAGHPKSILVVNSDITEKKRLEAQFYRAQRLESIGTLASGIAHDLNNVFTPILALSQLLRLKLQNLDARSQELLDMVGSSAERGANLVKQLLAFARGADGKSIPLQVENLLHEVANVAQQTFPKSIALQKQIPADSLWLVAADPTHLHQVLMNLCVNARDAMPDGGTLTLAAQNQFIDIATARMHLDAKVGNYVAITVTDTGSGIPANLLDRIFDPFFTTKEPGKGTGLGLSTVLGIVRNRGGFLQVTSEVGKGTQFQVYLPAMAGATLEPPTDEIMLQGQGQTILIVDDEAAVRQTNQSLLESYQFKTLTASDGQEALEQYQAHQQEIYAVLMDIMMPNLDGMSAIRRLRQINPHVKIIAISGLPSKRQRVLLAGANVFLAKPYTTQDLLMAIHELMQP